MERDKMDIRIRDHIIHNFQDDDVDTLRRAIDQSIQEQDEITLPGMGVFFEIIWTDADEKMKEKMLNLLQKRFHLEK